MKRALIVGASKSILSQLEHFLNSPEFIVAGSASTGAEALVKSERLQPDIVLMDSAVTGEMDAIDTARVIQKGFGIPVLLLVDQTDEQLKSRANEAMLNEWCAKPIRKGVLKGSIEDTLKRWETKKDRSRLYEELVEDTYDLIHVQDGRGNIIFINNSVVETLGYARDEIIGKNIKNLVTPDTYRILMELFRRQLKGEGVSTFEMQVYDKQGNIKTLETRERLVWEGKRIVEVQGISRDVTERKLIETELASINRLKEQLLGSYDLMDKLKLITDGVVEIFDADFARIWLVKPGDLCNEGCFHEGVKKGPHACLDRTRCLHLTASSGRYVHTDGKVHRRVPFGAYKIGRIASGRDPRFLTNDVLHDPLIHDRASADKLGMSSFAGYRLISKDGDLVGVLALFSKRLISPQEDALLEDLANTTAQVIQSSRTEEILRESEERYRALFENATFGVFSSLPKGKLLRANKALAQMLGYSSPEEMLSSIKDIGRDIYSMPSNREKIIEKIMEKGTWGVSEEYFRRKDGATILVRLHTRPVYGPDSTFLYLEGFVEDITEKKRAEEERRRDQELKEKILQTAAVAITFAENRQITWGNAAMLKTFGFTDERQYIGKSISILYASDEEYQRVGNLVYDGEMNEGIIETVVRLRRADSTEFLGLLRASIVCPGEPLKEVVVSYLDITEKSRAEEAIRRDQQLKDKILQTATVGIAFAEGRKITWANAAMEQTFGFSEAGEYVGKDTSILYASDEEYLRIGKLAYEGIKTGEIIEAVARFKRADSSEFLGLVRVSFVDPANPLKEIVVSISDITEKMKAEEALRESEQRYRLLAEHADDIIFTMDANLRFTYISPSVTRVRGFTVEEAMAQPIEEVLTPDSLKKAMWLFEEGMKAEAGEAEGRIYTQRLDLEETRKDGTTIWTETTFSVLRDENDVFSGLLGITRDISERRRAEERSRILAELLDVFPASITIHDLDGTFLFANKQTLDVHGYTKDELLNLSLLEVDAPESARLMAPRIKTLLQEGEASFEVEHVRKDGTRIPMIVNAKAAHWEGNTVILSVAIDISMRRYAEAALIESEEKYRMVVENAYEGIAVIQENIFVFTNRRLLDIFGYTEEEFLGRSYSDFLVADDQGEADAEYHRKITGNAYTYLSLLRVITKTGEVRWTEVSGVQIPWGGKPALLIFVRDVTERRKIEQALLQSEAKYRDLIENAIDLIFTVDLEGRFLEVNESLLRETGYSKEEIISSSFRDFVHPDDLDIALEAYEKGKQGLPHEFEMRSRKKDGTHGWYSFVIRPIVDIYATVEYVHCVARNITDRKEAEEALLESEEKFRGMFETSRDFMFISAPDGRILDYNPLAREFFGYTDQEVKETNIIDIYANPDERDAVLSRLMQEGFVENYEIELKKKDGSLIEALVTATVRRDKQGNIMGFQGAARDITQLKRMERQLLQAEKLSGLGTMISGVAHEINNPLTAIMGNAELMMMNDSIAPSDRKSLEVILHESERAAKIVGGLLTFAREHTPERRMVSVNDVIMEAHRLREYSLRVSNIRTELLLSDDLPLTFADPYQLQQVFSNIINNARDALMDVGGGTLAIRTLRNNVKLLIEFEDDGPGIAAENLQKIFDPFFTTKDIGKGTGLGLSIAYGIIKEHNGKIDIRSRVGGGARFVVELPIIDGAERVVIRGPSAPKTATTGRSVLVVDDERDVLEYLSRVLTQYGYAVKTATAAEEALVLMGKQAFDAVVADIKMPGMGGKEMHAYISEHLPGAEKKVLFITGDILGDETQTFIAKSGNVCLKKPFKIAELITRLNEIVGT